MPQEGQEPGFVAALCWCCTRFNSAFLPATPLAEASFREMLMGSMCQHFLLWSCPVNVCSWCELLLGNSRAEGRRGETTSSSNTMQCNVSFAGSRRWTLGAVSTLGSCQIQRLSLLQVHSQDEARMLCWRWIVSANRFIFYLRNSKKQASPEKNQRLYVGNSETMQKTKPQTTWINRDVVPGFSFCFYYIEYHQERLKIHHCFLKSHSGFYCYL